MDPEPHDCEFMSAPIGEKHCHCARTVTVSEPTLPDAGPALQVPGKAVHVTWEKVEE
jgi:hypothetical protein